MVAQLVVHWTLTPVAVVQTPLIMSYFYKHYLPPTQCGHTGKSNACQWQVSHSHGKSWKKMLSRKVMENDNFSKHHGKWWRCLMEFSSSSAKCQAQSKTFPVTTEQSLLWQSSSSYIMICVKFLVHGIWNWQAFATIFDLYTQLENWNSERDWRSLHPNLYTNSGVGSLQPAGRIWPTASFCPACGFILE